MSRCFPFPPPGYQKKPLTDDIDLLKKEKPKEKKHNKDKPKRDSKDKHREKKKDKEKGKNSNLDVKKVDNGDGFFDHKKPSMQFRREQLHKKDESCKESYSFLADKKPSSQLWGQNGDLAAQNRIKSEDIRNYKFVEELSRRLRDDEKGTCDDAQATLLQNVINGSKGKENDNVLKNKDVEKDRMKEKTDLKKAERDKNVNIKKNDTVASFDKNFWTHSPNINIQRAGNEFKKRKDMETNVSSHETVPRSKRMARPASNILTENRRKQDFFQNPGLNISDKQGPCIEEQRINGITKPPIATTNHIAKKPIPINPPPSVPNNVTTQPLPGSKRNPSTRPPPVHPDAKYLNQILTVPKLDQWSGLDNQEWLFSGKEDSHFKKTSPDGSLNGFHIWSEAKNLEAINLCALPYVIPY